MSELELALQFVPRDVYRDIVHIRVAVGSLPDKYSVLKPQCRRFEFQGRQCCLFMLHGSLPHPTLKHGVPVTIYFDPSFPTSAPRCYVSPFGSMALVPGHSYVHAFGRISTTLLDGWQASSPLEKVLSEVESVFGASSPLMEVIVQGGNGFGVRGGYGDLVPQQMDEPRAVQAFDVRRARGRTIGSSASICSEGSSMPVCNLCEGTGKTGVTGSHRGIGLIQRECSNCGSTGFVRLIDAKDTDKCKWMFDRSPSSLKGSIRRVNYFKWSAWQDLSTTIKDLEKLSGNDLQRTLRVQIGQKVVVYSSSEAAIDGIKLVLTGEARESLLTSVDQPTPAAPESIPADPPSEATQEQMLSLFRETLVKKSKLMQRTPAVARFGKDGGQDVATYVDGKMVAKQRANRNFMVVKSSSEDKEEFVVPCTEFFDAWTREGTELNEEDPMEKQLKTRGFKNYQPLKERPVHVYVVLDEDLCRIPGGKFQAAAGWTQEVRVNDLLIMPAANSVESKKVWWLHATAMAHCFEETQLALDAGFKSSGFKSFQRVKTKESLPVSDTVLPAGSGGVVQAATACSVTVQMDSGALVTMAAGSLVSEHTSQAQLMSMFKDKILALQDRREKFRPGMARPAVLGETVITIVDQVVTSETVVEDETSWVVKANTVDSEEYVLKGANFERNWQMPGQELDDYHKVLRSRGFRRFHPMAGKSNFFLEIMDEDADLVPSGKFISAWGAVQPCSPGDFLVMPAPEDRATEIYLMPFSATAQFRPWNDDVGQIDRSLAASMTPDMISVGRMVDSGETGDLRASIKGLFRNISSQPLLICLGPLINDHERSSTLALCNAQARKLAKKYPDLTANMRAAITSYTLELEPPEGSPYWKVNEALRKRQRSEVQKWVPYVTLILESMKRLPKANVMVVFRGYQVAVEDLGPNFEEDAECVMAGFTSAATDIGVMEDFVGDEGPRTLVTMKLINKPRSFRDFSMFPAEAEVVLPPGATFKVESHFNAGHGLTLVSMQQVESVEELMCIDR